MVAFGKFAVDAVSMLKAVEDVFKERRSLILQPTCLEVMAVLGASEGLTTVDSRWKRGQQMRILGLQLGFSGSIETCFMATTARA